jgi:hypothetical protein
MQLRHTDFIQKITEVLLYFLERKADMDQIYRVTEMKIKEVE